MKRKSIDTFVLIMLLTAVMFLVSCAGTHEPDNSGENTDLLNYRIADKAEGAEMMLSNDAYYDGMTQNDLDFKMQKKQASIDEYKAFAKEQVLDFTDEQKAIIDEHMERISNVIEERGYKLPELEQIVFINTTMQEECGSKAYTHGTQIYMDGNFLTKNSSDDKGTKFLDYVFSHELFHCMTRCNSEFRSEMYGIIHFTTREDDYKLPPSVEEYFSARLPVK